MPVRISRKCKDVTDSVCRQRCLQIGCLDTFGLYVTCMLQLAVGSKLKNPSISVKLPQFSYFFSTFSAPFQHFSSTFTYISLCFSVVLGKIESQKVPIVSLVSVPRTAVRQTASESRTRPSNFAQAFQQVQNAAKLKESAQLNTQLAHLSPSSFLIFRFTVCVYLHSGTNDGSCEKSMLSLSSLGEHTCNCHAFSKLACFETKIVILLPEIWEMMYQFKQHRLALDRCWT